MKKTKARKPKTKATTSAPTVKSKPAAKSNGKPFTKKDLPPARQPKTKHEKIIAYRSKQVVKTMDGVLRARGSTNDRALLLYKLADQEGMWVKDVAAKPAILKKAKLKPEWMTEEVVARAKHLQAQSSREIQEWVADYSRRVLEKRRAMGLEPEAAEDEFAVVPVKAKPEPAIKKEKKKPKEKVDRTPDKFGNIPGSQAADINAVVLAAKKPLTPDALAKATGLPASRIKQYIRVKSRLKQIKLQKNGTIKITL